VCAPHAYTERVTVGQRAGDPPDADTAGRAGHVLDNERLGEREPHSFGQDARQHVERPACRGRHNYRDWTRRIGLRARDSQDGRQRSDTRCQVQKSTAGKFHDVPPGCTKAIPIPVPLKGATISAYGTTRKHLRGKINSAY
jgi:hypothetical protein